MQTVVNTVEGMVDAPLADVLHGSLLSFVGTIVDTACMTRAQVIRAIIIMERLGKILPHLPIGDLSRLGITSNPDSEFDLIGLPGCYHRIAIAVLTTSREHLTGVALGNQEWHTIIRDVFSDEEILEMQVQPLLDVVGLDIYVSDEDIIDRCYMVIYPAQDRRSCLPPRKLHRVIKYIYGLGVAPPACPTPEPVDSPIWEKEEAATIDPNDACSSEDFSDVCSDEDLSSDDDFNEVIPHDGNDCTPHDDLKDVNFQN